MAHFVIDRGDEHFLRFVTFINETGECWIFRQPDIRLWTNITEGRLQLSPFTYGEDQDNG